MMSEITQDMIDCWRANYGLDQRSPADAARWWCDSTYGMAPSGAVAALGLVLQELDALRKDAERYALLRGDFSPMGLNIDGQHAWAYRRNFSLKGPTLDAAIDAAIDAAREK